MNHSFRPALLTLGFLTASHCFAQEIATIPPAGTLSGHATYVRGVAFSPDGKSLTSAGEDVAIVWDAATGKILYRLATPQGPTKSYSVAYAPEGKTIAVGGYFGKVFLFDADTGKFRSTIEGPSLAVHCLAYSPDGKLLAASHDQAEVMIFDAKESKLLGNLKATKGNIESFTFSSDGKILAAITRETLTIWDVASRSMKVAIPLDSQKDLASYMAVACSPTMPIVAADGGPLLKQKTMFYDLKTFELKGSLIPDDFEPSVKSLAFSPDGKILATGAAGGNPNRVSISLWDVTSGQRIAVLTGGAEGVSQVAFSTDGRRIAASSLDKSVRVWNLGGARARPSTKAKAKSRTKAKSKKSAG